MIRKFLKPFKSLKNLFISEDFKIQTFTYFIPSPPRRETGYREKQFDKEFYEFINKGYEIISINTQQCNDASRSGMWFICTVKAKNAVASQLDFTDFFDQLQADQEFKDSLIHEHDFPEDLEKNHHQL